MSILGQSACVVVLNGPNVLVVPRKKNLALCGLPGGKYEQGETIAGTAIRETREETGLDVVLRPDPIYTGDDGHGLIAACYFAEHWSGTITPGPGETMPRWGTWLELFDASPFGVYNRFVHDAVEKLGLFHTR